MFIVESMKRLIMEMKKETKGKKMGYNAIKRETDIFENQMIMKTFRKPFICVY